MIAMYSEAREFHVSQSAKFLELGGMEVPAGYGDLAGEFEALRKGVAILDLSSRGRLCLTGADRIGFLHGQVTNDVKKLSKGQNTYAALVNAKAKMESDLFIHQLGAELLLDFEPGFAQRISARLEKYVIAEDVQICDVQPAYGLITLQGPRSAELLRAVFPSAQIPESGRTVPFLHEKEFYLASVSRLEMPGFDLFAPAELLATTLRRFSAEAKNFDGKLAGWEAFESARVVDGRPRFGADMDENTLAPEAGIERCAISYNKGCYIGQEIISRIRTYGRVAKSLRHLHFVGAVPRLPKRNDPIYADGKESGFLTSAVQVPGKDQVVGLGYLRHEVASQTEVDVKLDAQLCKALNTRIA